MKQILLASLLVAGCATGPVAPPNTTPLELRSDPPLANVCAQMEGRWQCQQTPAVVFYANELYTECFTTAENYRFEWNSGTWLSTQIEVCPGNTHFVAKHPGMNISHDMAYAQNPSGTSTAETAGGLLGALLVIGAEVICCCTWAVAAVFFVVRCSW